MLEDDAIVRTTLRDPLRERGFTLLEATTLAEADAILRVTDVDVIIADGVLPDGLGVDWIARIRARGTTTPIVFVSASVKDFNTYATLKRELAVTAIAYKPLDPEQFAEDVAAAAG